MNAFTIKDLENLSGIKAHTIRIWEQRYAFLKPQRTDTNIRYYSNEELKKVLNISLLNRYGFKISHISRMQPDEINDRILSLSDPRAVQERIVNELLQEMVDLRFEQFEKILTAQIAAKGIERTVLQVIFPFLERIGLLWLSGHIFPGQEHLVSNIVRQKLLVAIDACVPVSRSEKTFLLFLPEGEYHELGLLFMHFILKNRGFRVIYLGADMPLDDVAEIAAVRKPEFALVHLTATVPNFSLEKYLRRLELSLGNLTTIMSGTLVNSYRKTVPENVRIMHSLKEVTEFLATL